jgi:hypothetical protein
MFCIVTEFLLALDGHFDRGTVSVTLAQRVMGPAPPEDTGILISYPIDVHVRVQRVDLVAFSLPHGESIAA